MKNEGGGWLMKRGSGTSRGSNEQTGRQVGFSFLFFVGCRIQQRSVDKRNGGQGHAMELFFFFFFSFLLRISQSGCSPTRQCHPSAAPVFHRREYLALRPKVLCSSANSTGGGGRLGPCFPTRRYSIRCALACRPLELGGPSLHSAAATASEMALELSGRRARPRSHTSTSTCTGVTEYSGPG